MLQMDFHECHISPPCPGSNERWARQGMDLELRTARTGVSRAMGTERALEHLRVSNLDFRSKMLQNDPGRPNLK